MSPQHPQPIPYFWVAANPVDVVRTAAHWFESAALKQLTAAFGAPRPVTQNLGALTRWSASIFDTRRGAERREATPATWTTDQIRALLSAAGPLGLLETAGPRRSSYEITVLLGGATTGNRLRTALASDLMKQNIDLGILVAVTAERSLSSHEHITDPDSVSDRTEWSNLLRNLASFFGPLRSGIARSGGTGNASWQDKEFNTAAGRGIRMLVAPSSSAHRRANTSDGLTFLLDRVPLAQRRHVLIITSTIYAPYQFFTGGPIVSSDGAEHVELIGTPTDTEGDIKLLTQRIAQEIHSALNAVTKILQP